MQISCSRLIPLAALLLWLTPATAQETPKVSIAAPQAPKAFAEQLRDASLIVSTVQQEGTTAQDLLAAAQADYARLLGVLYAEGYYGGVIRIRVNGQEAASIPPLQAPDRIERIEISVARNAQFTFSTARIAPLPKTATLPKGFRAGAPAKAALIERASRTGVAAWRATGHAKALVADQTIVADHPNATLGAEIRLAPGPRLRFGTLRVTPSDPPSRVRAARIRAIAGLPSGQTFSPDEAADTANRLRRTGAFRSVVLREAETPNPDGTLDFSAQVVDAKPRRVGAGAELSSLEGVTLSGFWLHRNLLGGAERLRFEGMIGGIGGDSGGEDFMLSARLDRPATFSPDTGLFLDARIESNDEPDYSERNVQIGGGLTHIFSDRLRGEAGIAYRLSDIDDDLGKRELTHLLLPSRLTWDDRDDPINATKGFFVDLSFTPFAGLNSESGDGVRVFADARHYIAFGANDQIVLAGRAQIGSVAGAEIAEVPAEMLFYSGGAGTVRGQDYQSLGVDLAPNVKVGGRSFTGFSGELRGMVTDNIQAVAFVDTGFVGEDALGTGEGDWHGGAGIGARYFTPVGPIRVDIGTPLDDAGQDFELYIGIGQAF